MSYEDDTYGSKAKYERFTENYTQFALQPKDRTPNKKNRGHPGIYYCKNTVNMQYFPKLFEAFEAKNLSYIRRCRRMGSFKLLLHLAQKDLKDLNPTDIDSIMVRVNTIYKSPKSRSDFIKDAKSTWRILLPEKDAQGRPDTTLSPYSWRHIKAGIDPSKIHREDILTVEELRKIISYFGSDPRIQAFIWCIAEGLCRPQEALLTRIQDLKLSNEGYARITFPKGKEGPNEIQLIYGYPHMAQWNNQHPQKDDPKAWLFTTTTRGKPGKPMTIAAINKQFRRACKTLQLPKRVTCYTFRRSGITHALLAGEDPFDIQKRARSKKVLTVYDVSKMEDIFKKQLVKHGLTNDPKLLEKYHDELPKAKKCMFCEKVNPFDGVVCSVCKRPLDAQGIKEETQKKEQEIDVLKHRLEDIEKALKLIDLAKKVS